jgi:hypothetical protein
LAGALPPILRNVKLIETDAWALGDAAINPNAKHCEATKRAAILPNQWPYSVIARSLTCPVLAWRHVAAATWRRLCPNQSKPSISWMIPKFTICR